MAITINVPDHLQARLEERARKEGRSAQDAAIEILGNELEPRADSETLANIRELKRKLNGSRSASCADMIDDFSQAQTLEEIVAKIQKIKPDLDALSPAIGSLAEALRALPDDPDFDLARWEADWAAVEAEMRSMRRDDQLRDQSLGA